MNPSLHRRGFLAKVAQATLVTTLGPVLASDMGLAPRLFADSPGPESLDFGPLEPLVRLLQETPLDHLQRALVREIRSGTPLHRLVAAGTLANARTFGGEDYVGFHTLMALSPALSMSGRLSGKEQALPILKVLYRNSARIQEHGGRDSEVLRPLPPEPSEGSPAEANADSLRAAIRRRDKAGAERLLAMLTRQGAETALDALLPSVQEDTEVHRTVLPYRAFDLLNVVGQEHADTLLRQSVRYCIKAEQYRKSDWDTHGEVLTKLLDEHHLLGKAPGQRAMADSALGQLADAIFSGAPEDAAGAMAAALAEGFVPDALAEALSLAANQILLRDLGRPPEWEFSGKPPGSVHGDSSGVHASDSANAWRHLASVSHGRNVQACLILGAWQVARDRGARSADLLKWPAIPTERQKAGVKTTDPTLLLNQLDEAIRGGLQAQAAALVHQAGAIGQEAEPVFALMLKYAVSEDGALHAEKYYQTVWDDFHSTRPGFRFRHLCGLARVTASEYGRPAPGMEEARELLGV